MRKKKLPMIVPIFSLILGILFIILGAFRGEAIVVLNKAIRICMECIGIG